MLISTSKIERKQLLQRAEEYRDKGYEILFHPSSEDLPDFLKNYRLDLVVRNKDETVVIEVRSRASLNPASTQYLRNLTKIIEQHPGWRLELVMTNPEDAIYSIKAEGSFKEDEIKSRLATVRQISQHDLESALLYSWSLIEASLRLVAEKEGLSLQKFDSRHLLQSLATEGIIGQSEYQILMNSFLFRNAIAHGFKTTPIPQNLVDDLIKITEQLLQEFHQ
ncbi:hypothetical protein Xen7305DRAFT_00005500 [Xenococcus sp. PCC 7305]|uniref:hypothetical protein n=1 Tax=Xenococcus sp. PCC 7305 TaxID=102125 RepID=UPI0002ABD0EB|nr:hypothetical protein [Xenococcus sp. PCC 7305]ELS00849.1 hypothetical protein Xen7305DRAFT_00005500 [Xenococcus sp. PCC 7305]